MIHGDHEALEAHLDDRYGRIIQEMLARCHFELSVERSGLPRGIIAGVFGDARDGLAYTEGRRMWSFPQHPDGTYTDRYPPTGAETIALLEALRAEGAGFLLVPARAFGALDQQEGFRRHLQSWHRCCWCDEHCIIYRLTDLPALTVLEVEQAPLDGDRLVGFHIDLPPPGGKVEAFRVPLAGWVLGRSRRPVAVAVLRDGAVVERAPVGVARPELATVYPQVPAAEQSGFQTTLSVPEVPSEVTLRIEAVLRDGRHLPVGTVRVAVLAGERRPCAPQLRVVATGVAAAADPGGGAGALLAHHIDLPAEGGERAARARSRRSRSPDGSWGVPCRRSRCG